MNCQLRPAPGDRAADADLEVRAFLGLEVGLPTSQQSRKIELFRVRQPERRAELAAHVETAR